MTAVRSPGVAAVVLAGGASRRMGADKPALEVAGTRLLDRVLAAVPPAADVVVVGPERPVARPVRWAREDPLGGGPAAALAAGLAAVDADVVAVLAADLPFLGPAVLTALADAVAGHDGAVLVDDDGRDQVLAGCWRTAALRTAVAATAAGPGLPGCSVRRLVDGLDVVGVRLPPDAAPAWFDCDTPDDLRRARERA